MASTRDSSKSELGSADAARGAVRGVRRKKLRQRSLRVATSAPQDQAAATERMRELDAWLQRPKQRVDCKEGMRPCPYVGCRYHLYLDVTPGTGTIRLSFPELEVWELQHTCALDVADSAAWSAESVSVLMNVSRERVRQIEASALSKLSRRGEVRGLVQE